MADSDGRDETGSISGKTMAKDSQLEDHNQQPGAINNPIATSDEEEEAREHQEAEPTVQETNKESREEEEDEKRDAEAGEEKEEINEDADPLMHGETIKKRKTDNEDGTGVATLTVVGGDLPGGQTGKAAMPTMMGGSGSEVGLGGGVSGSAATGWGSLPRPVYKYTYSLRMPATGQAAVGAHGRRRRYEFELAVAAAAAARLDDNAAAAANRGAEEPPPGPAGQDEGGGHEDEEEDDDEDEEEEEEK